MRTCKRNIRRIKSSNKSRCKKGQRSKVDDKCPSLSFNTGYVQSTMLELHSNLVSNLCSLRCCRRTRANSQQLQVNAFTLTNTNLTSMSNFSPRDQKLWAPKGGDKSDLQSCWSQLKTGELFYRKQRAPLSLDFSL